MLKSTIQTQEIHDEVIAAAQHNFYYVEQGSMTAFYEHGSWWVRYFCTNEEDYRAFAVVDVRDSNGDRFDFEEV